MSPLIKEKNHGTEFKRAGSCGWPLQGSDL